MSNMSNPTPTTLREIIDLLMRYSEHDEYHTTDNCQPEDGHRDFDEEVATQSILEQLKALPILQDEEQIWDNEFSMCNRCDYEPLDSKDCICVMNNKLRAKFREAIEEWAK